MTYPDPPIELAGMHAVEPAAIRPLPYFSGPAARPPLVVRLIRLFGLAVGATDIVSVVVLMFWPGFGMSRYFSFAFRRGYSPGLSLVVDTILSACLLAASITSYSNRRVGKIGFQLWAWASVIWIAYCLVARTAYQLPILRMTTVGTAAIVLAQGIRDAVFPVLTLAVLRLPEIRDYFDVDKRQPGQSD